MRTLRPLSWLAPLLLLVAATGCGNSAINGIANRTSNDTSASTMASPAAGGEGWRPAGQPWTPLASSHSGTFQWTAFSTPGTHNTVCFAFDLDPPRNISTSGPPGVSLPPVADTSLYEGREPHCTTRRTDMDRTNPVVVIYFPNEDSTAPYNLVIGQVSNQIHRIRATFSSGESTEISVDDTGLFVHQYSAQLRLSLLEGEQPPLGSGRPKGTFECPVQTVGEATTPAVVPQVHFIPGCSTND